MKKRIFSIILLLITVTVVASQPAMAITQKAVDAINGQYPYYDASDTSGTCELSGASAATVSLSGNDNEQKIYNYLVAKGLSPVGAAGIDGNFGQESHWNPATPGGYLAQWGGSRLSNLQNFASKQNKPVTDLGVQLDFMWQELNGSYPKVLEHVKAATTVEDATEQFMGPIKLSNGGTSGGYENPGRPELAKRIAFAKGALIKYGGAAASPAALITSIATNTCSGITGNGQNTKFYDGFTVYSQCDPAWGGKPYGDDTICANACGPSALAMIVTNLTGRKVTPDVLAAYADKNGLYVQNTGSSWLIAPTIATEYGLKSQKIGADVAKITAVLQAGGLVAAPGSGASPYTKGGHYIVIRAVTATGKWKIGDSGHRDTSDKEWDPQQLVSEMHEGGVYAITK